MYIQTKSTGQESQKDISIAGTARELSQLAAAILGAMREGTDDYLAPGDAAPFCVDILCTDVVARQARDRSRTRRGAEVPA